LQPYLLRILEEKKVYPVGATEGQAIDVRIIAATNKNLKSAIAEGVFRDDSNEKRIFLLCLRLF